MIGVYNFRMIAVVWIAARNDVPNSTTGSASEGIKLEFGAVLMMLWTTKRPSIVSVLRVKYKETFISASRYHADPVSRINLFFKGVSWRRWTMVAGDLLHILDRLNISL